jgi:hypothetical protein
MCHVYLEAVATSAVGSGYAEAENPVFSYTISGC